MRIRFWYMDGACSLAVRICLEEIGTKFEGIRTPMGEGGTASAAFGLINPKRRVPVLALDDEVITELPAILTAVSQLAPRHKLMGASNLDIVRSYEWLAWLTGTLHGHGFGSLWRPLRFSDDPDAYASISLKGRAVVEDCFATIEQRLHGGYGVGSSFTAVDALLFVYFSWGNMIGVDMRRYGNYARLADMLTIRSSVTSALKAESVMIDGARG